MTEVLSKRHAKGAGVASLRLFTINRNGVHDHWNTQVVIKADRAVAPGKESKDNVRFVLTNIQGAPHRLYKRLYCPRGDAENRIKELKGGLQMDRTSCSRFQANQFRLLLAAAGYALMQELRGRPGTRSSRGRKWSGCGCSC